MSSIVRAFALLDIDKETSYITREGRRRPSIKERAHCSLARRENTKRGCALAFSIGWVGGCDRSGYVADD
jgi:hypothetical protein